jgi:polysaccharide export outer membrane protein
MPYSIASRSSIVAEPVRTGGQRIALAALVLVLAGGCRSQTYRAAQLPSELRAAQRARTSAVNLAQVSRGGPANSLIGAGDLLEVAVSSGLEPEVRPFSTRVADDGTIEVPDVGRVQVAGLEPHTAALAVSQASVDRGIFVQPQVSVEVASKAVNHVTVLGAVANPGLQKLPKNSSDLISALAAAGGLAEDAGTEVEIIRPASLGPAFAGGPSAAGGVQPASYAAESAAAPQTIKIDLAAEEGFAAEQSALADRDVVMVRPQEKEVVFVGGLVNKAGQFELPRDQDVHLLDALMLGGGLSSPVADKVLVLRQLPDKSGSVTIQASVRKAKRDAAENLRIAAGDTVIVEQTPATAVVEAMTRLIRVTIGVADQTSIF